MAVAYEGAGSIGTITLDNPPANSYEIGFMRELGQAISQAGEDPTARIVVLRSGSEKFFSAGADVKRFLANEVEDNMEMIRTAHEALQSIAQSPKLFIACVAGHALGGGLEIALACDIRYAIDGRFRLGTPEVSLGLLPGNGGTQRLPRLIGLGPALELLATGRQLTPEEACRLGILSQVFADQEAFDAHVQSLAVLPPLALAADQARRL
jgi:enoyl-CoA hydratase/carnithine racemase